MKLGRIASVTAASAALVLTVANPAAAADHTMRTGDAFGDVTGYSGKGWFNERGDVVTICDDDADGIAVKMWVYKDELYGAKAYEFSVGGEGNCATRKASMGSPYNLRENRHAAFLFCLHTSSTDGYECKGYRFYNDH